MASHTRGPRGRSRKPRPPAQTERRPRPVASAPVSPQRTFGERPNAAWHPLPLSEILILAGAIAFVVAVSRLRHGPTSGGPLLLAGIAAVSLGTVEVSWREHSSGFRSHTILLALLPVIVLHSAVVLGWAFLAKPSQVVNVGMFAVDIALFVLLFRLLRARFLDARARASVRG
jgi:hypothetical protein